jgi:hypothetical protein
VGEYETRFGFIYATFTTIGQEPHKAKVTVYIDDATRRPHVFGEFTVTIADQTTDGLKVALSTATEHMGREWGVIGMTWVPSYMGWKGCQWHPDTFQPVNGRGGKDTIRVSAMRQARHARQAA